MADSTLIPQEDFTLTIQDQTMAKSKQPIRELKKKVTTQDQSGPPANPSSEPVTSEVKKTQQTGRGSRKKKDDGPPVDPSSEPVKGHVEPEKKKRTRTTKKDAPVASQDAPGTTDDKSATDSLPAVQASSQGILEALADDEVILREQLEYEVEQGLDGAFKVANALLQIREKRLYRSTHATYEEYVEDRFQMSSRRARHLTFAAGVVKSLEDAGVSELPTNESQVRGLQGLSPEDYKKVWEEAQRVANGKGKSTPGRKDVQTAAGKVGRPKGTKNRKTTPEEKKVDKAVIAGVIQDPSQVTITQVDEGIDSAKVQDIDLPDLEWLEQFPIRAELNEHCKTLFDQEALFYRWFNPHRKPLVRDVTSKLAAEVRKVAKRVGPYVTRIEKALSLADPRSWVVCKPCNGTGYVGEAGPCNNCKSAGYRLG
jgi:hypothetical protein